MKSHQLANIGINKNNIQPNIDRLLAEREVTIITEVLFGSGDFYAAMKFIKRLQQDYPDMKINWLIRSTDTRTDIAGKIDEAKKSFTNNVSIQVSDFSKTINVAPYKSSKLIMFFPTVHYIRDYDFQQLKSIDAKLLQIHEHDAIYEMHHLANKAELTAVNSGFDGLGLFLEDFAQLNMVNKHVNVISPINLNPDNELFFSYLSNDKAQLVNESTFENFARIALELASPAKPVDIICNSPLTDLHSDFDNYAWDHGFSEIVYIKKNKDGKYIEDKKQSPRQGTGNKQLRIVDPFPLSHNQLLTLIANAHPFIQTTGDQSLSEVLSVSSLGKGVFPFYQMMRWKAGLHENWVTTAENIVGKKSPYVKLLKMISRNNKVEPNAIVELWNKKQEQILSDSVKLYTAIHCEKNLSDNLSRYVKLMLKLADELSDQNINQYPELLAQLIVKIKDDDSVINILKFINGINDTLHAHSITVALTEFIKLNNSTLTEDTLKHIILQLLQSPVNDRTFVAITCKKILNTLPLSVRDNWIDKIIPEIREISTSLHPMILDVLNDNKNPILLQKDEYWLKKIVSGVKKWESIKYHRNDPLNHILLAVHVLEGTGDITKFIDTYHQLQKSFPHSKITNLIKCGDTGKATLLKILRANNIPMKNTHIATLSTMDTLLDEMDALPKDRRAALLRKSNFYDFDNYSLIISVATPFPEINLLLRNYSRSNTPYLEIGEVEYCSYLDKAKLPANRDYNHHLYAMGAGDRSVGLEITTLNDLTPADILKKMDPILASSLIDGDLTDANINKFITRSIFMPAYVMNDKGVLSINYFLEVIKTNFPQNDEFVLWVYQLPVDENDPLFIQELKSSGIGSLVIYDNFGKKRNITIDDSTGNKQLRIVCGRVDNQDFDLMYKLAENSSGLGGCVGQNSFEKAVSFNLLPAFYAPPWQLSIIYQCQSLLTKVFKPNTSEYQCVSEYLRLLSNISNTINQTNTLFKASDLKPHLERLKSLPPEKYLAELNAICNDVSPQAGEHFPHALQHHPALLLKDYFTAHDMTLLKSSWIKVCEYIKTNKNLFGWMIPEVAKYISTATPAMIENNSALDSAAALKLLPYHNVIASTEIVPEITKYLNGILDQVMPEHHKIGVKLIINDSDSELISIIPGVGEPTIAISVIAMQQLNSEEIRYGLSLCAEKIKNYPVENTRLKNRDFSNEELLDNLTGDYESGITYHRKQISCVQKAMSNILNRQGKTNLWYEYSNLAEKDAEMIKLIEMRLAQINNHKLANSLTVSKSTTIPGEVSCEISKLIMAWEDEVKTASTDPAIVINELLAMVPGLRVKSTSDYRMPSLLTEQFIKKLSNLTVSQTNNQHRLLLEKLADAVFEHRCASLTEIYKIISNKFGNTIIPLGPYKILAELLQKFKTARNQGEALSQAEQIEDFLKNPIYHHLFKNSSGDLNVFDETFKNGKVDDYIFSSYGAMIDWNRIVGFSSWDGSFNNHLKWCTQPNSETIAAALFRLGFVDKTELLDILTPEFIVSSTRNHDIMLGKIPSQHSHSSYGDIKPELSFDYPAYYLEYRLKPNLVREPTTITRASIEKFISEKIQNLATADKFPQAAHILMNMFDKYLKISPDDAKALIRQFYLDKTYINGLHAIKKIHKKLGTGFTEKFDAHLPRGVKRLTAMNTSRMPYLQFLLKHNPEHFTLTELLEILGKNFSIVYATFPLDIILEGLNLKINNLGDILLAKTAMKNFNILLKSYESRSYIDAARSNLSTESAINIPHIDLFTEESYKFIKKCGSRDVCENLFTRADIVNQIRNLNSAVSIPLHKLAAMYKIFDRMITWPDSTLRLQFSAILLREFNKADADEQLKAVKALMYAKSALTDTDFAKEIINRWVDIQAPRLGPDDGSYLYYSKLARIVKDVLSKVPSFYSKDMLEGLTVAVNAQDKICGYIDSIINPTTVSDTKYFDKSDALIKTAKKISEKDCSLAAIDFFSQEITRASLDKFLNFIEAKNYEILTESHIGYQRIDRDQAEFMSIMLYHQFWNRSIEERAVIMNNLLIPSSEMATANDANIAYIKAYNYITNLLFPDNTEDNAMGKALLTSYLDAGNIYIRPYLLAAVLTANKLTHGASKNITVTLPKLAEAMGAAGVKGGQGAHSYPHTPADIRESLSFLKSRARIPYRWELWKLIKKAIPAADLNRIKSVKRLLGGASFYLAIEVELKDGNTAVLRLMRDNAHDEAEYGFAHLKETVNLCKYPGVLNINRDLSHIIDEAAAGAKIEIDHQCVAKQYEIADKIYNNVNYDVQVDGKTYHINIEPVKLFSYGPGYQFISMANGTEFNDLKRDPKNTSLCQAVAFAVCKTELRNMLGDGPCDFDRHGAQSRVQCMQTAANEYSVKVTNYDFGEISPTPATPAQLHHCHKFIDDTTSELFSAWNILAYLTSNTSNQSLMDQFADRMMTYIRDHTVDQKQNADKHDDLSRLRGIFKGMLALNDYFEVLAQNNTLLMQLKDVLQTPRSNLNQERLQTAAVPPIKEQASSWSVAGLFSTGLSYFGFDSTQDDNEDIQLEQTAKKLKY